MVFPQCGANENILNVSLLYLNNCSIICSTSFLTISAERQNSLRLYISLYIWLQLVKCHVLHSDEQFGRTQKAPDGSAAARMMTQFVPRRDEEVRLVVGVTCWKEHK